MEINMMDELHSNIKKLKELSNYLDQLESEMSLFFNLSVDMILICHATGEIIKANPAWKEWLGWEKEDLIGHSFYEFVHPDDMPITEQAASHVCDEPITTPFKNRYVCKDGSFKLLSWRAICYNNKFYCTARVVSE